MKKYIRTYYTGEKKKIGKIIIRVYRKIIIHCARIIRTPKRTEVREARGWLIVTWYVRRRGFITWQRAVCISHVFDCFSLFPPRRTRDRNTRKILWRPLRFSSRETHWYCNYFYFYFFPLPYPRDPFTRFFLFFHPSSSTRDWFPVRLIVAARSRSTSVIDSLFDVRLLLGMSIAARQRRFPVELSDQNARSMTHTRTKHLVRISPRKTVFVHVRFSSHHHWTKSVRTYDRTRNM